MTRRSSLIVSLLVFAMADVAAAAEPPPTADFPSDQGWIYGKVAQLYRDSCSGCHGRNFDGGKGPSLVAPKLRHGSDDDSVARSIRSGFPDAGMPAFGATLSAADIRTLVIYLRERRMDYSVIRSTHDQPTGPLSSELYRFRLETIADGLETPWSIAFLPHGRMLVTERPGRLRVIDHGRLLPEAIKGIPETRDYGEGGLLSVVPHPDYVHNGWIYLSYIDIRKTAVGQKVTQPAHFEGTFDPSEIASMEIVRGRIRDGAWVDQQIIWQAPPQFYLPGQSNFGGRMAFDRKGLLYFTYGERYFREHAQDLTRPNGKVHRLHDDGRIPADNPFLGQPGAFPSIWSYGHRNPQGLAIDPHTGLLWESEHGPRGGDKINIIRRGRNYGWPVITYGMEYDGSPISDKTAQEGMEQPIVNWTPSIAVCGIAFYEGNIFPKWRGNLIATSLAQQELRRLVIKGETVTHQEVLLKDIGRLRDVASGPDGYLYIVINNPGRVVLLVPERH